MACSEMAGVPIGLMENSWEARFPLGFPRPRWPRGEPAEAGQPWKERGVRGWCVLCLVSSLLAMLLGSWDSMCLSS